MARIRSIKPEFPQSETIGALSRDARLLFVQVWTIVDDEGRARASSRLLASLLYPYDDDAAKLMVKWLTELEHNKCIRLYEADGSQYLEVVNWLKHQKIDRPSASRMPAYREHSASTREHSRGSDADLGPRTLDQDLGGDLGGDQESARCASVAEPSDDWPPNFRELFWMKYPNKIGRPKALGKLEKARGRGITWNDLWGGLCRYVAKTDDRPWCNPETWLNQERWTDQPAAGDNRRNGHAKSLASAADELIARAEGADRTIDLEPDDWSYGRAETSQGSGR